MTIAGPLSYGPNGAGFSFEYHMENIGNSPALRVFPQTLLYAKKKKMPTEEIVLKDFVAGLNSPTADPLGFTIGPKSKRTFVMGQAVPYSEIAESAISYKVGDIQPRWLPIKLIGVVTYQFAFSDEMHETSFYYDLMKWNNGVPPSVVGLSREDGDVAAEKLVLRENILFSPYMT